MQPGRNKRAEKICVVVRGMPGVGKHEIAAKLEAIERKESGKNKVKTISINQYLDACVFNFALFSM